MQLSKQKTFNLQKYLFITLFSYLRFQSALVKVLIWDVMELIAIVTSLLTETMAVASAKYQLGVRFIRGIATSICVLFCHSLKLYHIPFYKRDSKWEPLHCSDQRHLGFWHTYVHVIAYGPCRVSYQGTSLCASDLHNALSPILKAVNRFDYAKYIR